MPTGHRYKEVILRKIANELVYEGLDKTLFCKHRSKKFRKVAQLTHTKKRICEKCAFFQFKIDL